MNPNWQNFLVRHGAIIEAGIVQGFSNGTAYPQSTANHTVLCDLSQYGTLRVSGEDSQSFLQNLLSNDLSEVTATRAQLSSLNSAKGRMLSGFIIWQEGDDYLLQLAHELTNTLHKKLSMYILRAKVKVTDISDEKIAMGIYGADADPILQSIFGDIPTHAYSCLTGELGCVVKIEESRFQIIAHPLQAEALWSAISLRAKPAGSPYWDWLNIRAGIPTILPQTQDLFVAQMINFDLIRGISFKKGCYPGQEIVARTHYLGKLKRRMYLAHLDTDAPPQAGDELFSTEMEGQATGIIVNATPAPHGGYDVLAVVQISSQETQTIHWKSLQGATLQFSPLPYTLLEC